jgi:hypothetical protein
MVWCYACAGTRLLTIEERLKGPLPDLRYVPPAKVPSTDPYPAPTTRCEEWQDDDKQMAEDLPGIYQLLPKDTLVSPAEVHAMRAFSETGVASRMEMQMGPLKLATAAISAQAEWVHHNSAAEDQTQQQSTQPKQPGRKKRSSTSPATPAAVVQVEGQGYLKPDFELFEGVDRWRSFREMKVPQVRISSMCWWPY